MEKDDFCIGKIYFLYGNFTTFIRWSGVERKKNVIFCVRDKKKKRGMHMRSKSFSIVGSNKARSITERTAGCIFMICGVFAILTPIIKLFNTL